MLGWSEFGGRRRRRLVALCAVLALLAPAAASGLTYSPETPSGEVAGAQNVTFVGVQGSFAPTGNGRVVAINTTSGELLWAYSNDSAGENVLYYDVDPLSRETVLVVEETPDRNATALVINWREDEVIDRFPVPSDTHDVDYLGGDRYAVADKYDHRAYVYDAAEDEVVWEFRFPQHFPEYPEAGNAPSTRPSRAGGYTHLNDVDAVGGGQAFLLSPRNFDRVVLVDSATKEVEWTLGEQDDHDILHEQHNPVLLSRSPPVVLVADSENDRVVEYRRHNNGSWERTWEYRRGLNWPRDADRLPNGNTLIVDTRNQRVIEVTPEKEIVWERRVPTMPYDVERLKYGDEPAGPPTGGAPNADRSTAAPAVGTLTTVAVTLREAHSLALWVLPPWIGVVEFYGLVAAGVVALCWTGLELAVGLAAWRRDR